MGIKYAHKYTYSIKNLSVDQLYFIAYDWLKNTKATYVDCNRDYPLLDVDVSWIVRGFGHGSVADRIDYLLDLSSAITDAGFMFI
jgi:hypothetical protein